MSHHTLHLSRDASPASHDLLLRLEGDLDLDRAADLRATLAELSPAPGQRVVVDLAAVAFLDSTALGVLVAAAKHLEGHGSELAIRSPHPRIRRVFELTGLTRVFDLNA